MLPAIHNLIISPHPLLGLVGTFPSVIHRMFLDVFPGRCKSGFFQSVMWRSSRVHHSCFLPSYQGSSVSCLHIRDLLFLAFISGIFCFLPSYQGSSVSCLHIRDLLFLSCTPRTRYVQPWLNLVHPHHGLL